MIPADVAGLSLTPPRLLYEALDPSWGSASLARPHLARALDGATITVNLLTAPQPPVDPRLLRPAIPGAAPEPPVEGRRVATFEVKPFVQPAVQPYIESPAVAWRGLLVEQRLLARPELIWTGAFPKGWEEGLAAPWVASLTEALTTLHRRYVSLTEERMADWGLRSLECVECRDERAAKLPPNLPPWQVQMRLSSSTRCLHASSAIRAMGALSRAHPELTFELLGWMEPAGARAEAEGPPATRFALTGPLMEALLGPWLVGEERWSAPRAGLRGYEASYRYARSWWRQPADPKRPLLPREQANGVSLAATAWGFTGEPEVLVGGEASAPEPGLDRSAAPVIETPAALPGERVRGKAARARKAAKGK